MMISPEYYAEDIKGMGMAELIAERDRLIGEIKGIEEAISDNDEISIDCNVVISYGQSVVAVAKNVQEAVTAALASMTGVKVVAVNVNVCGIVRQ